MLDLDPKPQTPCLAMRLRDAARAIGVSDRTLWTWTQKGIVPHVRIGSTVLYPRAVVEQWLSDRAKTTPAAEAAVSTPEGAANVECL